MRARGAAVDSSSTRARLLLANGKFELGEANEPQRNRPGSVSVEGPSKLMGGGDV